MRAFAHGLGTPIIRINPTERQVPRARDVGIPVGALEGITGICTALAGVRPLPVQDSKAHKQPVDASVVSTIKARVKLIPPYLNVKEEAPS